MSEQQLEGRSYQPPPSIWKGKIAWDGRRSHSTKRTRFYRDVGVIGIRTPKDAKTGTYVDKKCPFTGDVSIRGRILRGTIVSTKMKRTVIVRRDYLNYMPKYARYEKRHTNIPAHVSPAFHPKEGDSVIIGGCRPLSKTIRFNVLKVEAKAKHVMKGFEGI